MLREDLKAGTVLMYT